MDYELITGKVALVTGSTRGMGRGIALRLARGGADIILHDQDPSQAAVYKEAASAEEVLAEIRATGRRCIVLYGDLASREAADAIAAGAVAEFGRIDVLVNCAGGDIGAAGVKAVPNDCVDIPDVDLHRIMDRNLTSAMHMTRAAVHPMMDRGEGVIINISSIAAQIACAGGSIYAVAKAGVIHWTRCLAAQLRPHGINVNCIAPGDTRTGRFVNSRYVPPERLAANGRLMRLGEPDDVGKACLFLASDLASFISGQTIAVDGGFTQTMQMPPL
jgi:NAD(P)-dependent dehydrogenase (short-subunit alcohol dehydrogenase family)